tara:strand:- start:239 stop:538 length:300 start_codon:yes stop_codon:yes gene_type:complete
MKQVNMNNRNSTAYVGSVYTADVNYMEEIENVRADTKKLNKTLKKADARNSWGSPLRYRVCIKAREAKVQSRSTAYNYHGDLRGGFENAKRIDIYVRES